MVKQPIDSSLISNKGKRVQLYFCTDYTWILKFLHPATFKKNSLSEQIIHSREAHGAFSNIHQQTQSLTISEVFHILKNKQNPAA